MEMSEDSLSHLIDLKGLIFCDAFYSLCSCCFAGGSDQNNVQHKPSGEPQGLHQQPPTSGGVYDQCQRNGHRLSDSGLFL